MTLRAGSPVVLLRKNAAERDGSSTMEGGWATPISLEIDVAYLRHVLMPTRTFNSIMYCTVD